MPADLFAFGPFELDAASRRLLKHGEPIAVPPRQFDLLLLLAARAGQVLSKDALIEAAWGGIAVTDNSLEQAISGLRRLLADDGEAARIETLARRGYRFAATVRRIERREPAEALAALLAPHRAWVEGRAALETLERSQIVHAGEVFRRMVAQAPDLAAAHIGLANAGVMQFEMTRSELAPDTAALVLAAGHAQEACRLDPRSGEAWATLGFVLDRTGHRDDALAAARMAVSLEPDNWRHHLRFAYVTWGEERLRGARRTLALLPGFPLAHWLAATVHVARGALDEAERELASGLASQANQSADGRFGGVALHWLLGVIQLARRDDRGAMAHFERELANEGRGQLYARECCANTWYAIGAVRLRQGDRDPAAAAFQETLSRVPRHPPALAALGVMGRLGADASTGAGQAADAVTPAAAQSADVALGRAVALTLRGDTVAAGQVIEQALATAPEGSALWTLPVDPLLHVAAREDVWAAPLARLRNRAA